MNNNATRLGGFAAGHFAYSVLCYLVLYGVVFQNSLLLGDLDAEAAGVAVALVLMALYLPIGCLMGAIAPWSRVPDGKALRLAVLTQAGIAWCWAALILVGVYVDDLMILTLALAVPTFTLALPSCVFLVGIGGILSNLTDAPWLMAFLAFWAGLLPPLLYSLGNFLVSRKKAAVQAAPPAQPEQPPEQTPEQTPET